MTDDRCILSADARRALLKRESAAEAAKYLKAQAAFRRQRNQILTKPVIRKCAPAVKAIRAEFAEAALQAGGDPAKVAAAKKRAQKAMTDALEKSVPRFSELKGLIDLSVTDNFGISHSYLNFNVRLFIEIVRAGESTVRTRTMLSNGITSHGAELSFSTSDIPDQTPFTLKFNPRDAFVKGEVIQVMVGSQVNLDCDADDMKSFLNALLWWEVKKIVVGMKA